MKVKSRLTGEMYDADKAIYIDYVPQFALYWANGGAPYLLDIIADKINGTRKIAFAFEKNDTMKDLYKKWNNRELE